MTRHAEKHDALLDELLKDYADPKDILGEHGLLRQLTKRVVERALEAELTAHLGYVPHARHGSSPGGSVANHRKQESSISQAIDFLTSDFRVWP
jgi:putative transposase